LPRSAEGPPEAGLAPEGGSAGGKVKGEAPGDPHAPLKPFSSRVLGAAEGIKAGSRAATRAGLGPDFGLAAAEER
jgi:hypothetical protein